MKPDIILKKGDETIIIDTKWKIPDGYIPADDDLKQMFVYNLYWSSYKSVLLYPGSIDSCTSGTYATLKNFDLFKNDCAVVTICVLNEQKLLDNEFGAKLLKSLEPTK